MFICAVSCNTEKQKPVIGFLVPTYTASRFVIEKQFIEAKALAMNFELLDANAEYSDKKQLEQAIELIDNGAKALIIIAVNNNTAASMVRYAKENGVKVIAYERMIANADVDVFIGPDDHKIGEQVARYALQHKTEGNYLLLGGDYSDKGAILFRQGVLSVLQPALNTGKINIIYDIQIEEWSEENAYKEMEYFLKLSPQMPDVILSAYDGLSNGAIKAYGQWGKSPWPLITGQDAEQSAINNIENGLQTMTICRSYKQQAELAVELAAELLNKGKIAATAFKNNGRFNVPVTIIEAHIIDKHTLNDPILKENMH
jgi:ABC-type xylose transport system substrate-binding protein